MKKKKTAILIVCAVMVIVAVVSALFIPKVKYGIANILINEYIAQDLKNVDNTELIASCSDVDSNGSTTAGFKETLRLGADSVIVDLCFKKDGTPVMCSDYSEAENAPTIESLFIAMNDEKFRNATVYLRVVQLSDMATLNELSVKYNVLDRLFLIGIDEKHYGLITSDDTIVPFFLDYRFSDDEIKSTKDNSFRLPDIIEKYDAAGLVIDSSQVSEELTDYLDGYEIPFLVQNISTDREMCFSIISGGQRVIVKKPQRAREILDLWTTEMQKRYESSVEKSLRELSEKN